MRLLLSSLREYIHLEKTAQQIAELLTNAGIEVEQIEELHSPSDVAFEVGLTANLGHCMSVFGIARELSAMTGQPLRHSPSSIEVIKADNQNEWKIQLQTVDCERYSVVTMSGIQIEPSPAWLALRLERSGIRSVNNIVDITNLVSHEFGQPMHAFDQSRLTGTTIVVRSAHANETLALLDDTVKELPFGTVVIDSNGAPIAVGGIMGGEESSVSKDTSSILLEAAYFSPKTTRKTAKALGISTDSSKRFERGANPAFTLAALSYAASLIQKVCPKAKVDGIYDCASSAFSDREIPCRPSQVRRILGFDVSAGEIEMVFTRLGFHSRWQDSDVLYVSVPYYRHDISEEIDLIEEVSRLLGMGTEKQIRHPYIGSTVPHDPLYIFSRQVKERLLTEGLQEFVTCNLISPKMIEIIRNHPIDSSSLVRVLNPMSEEQSILRPSLLPGLLDVVKRNNNQRLFDIAGFEVGNVHFKKNNKYIEQLVVGIVLTGRALPHHFATPERDVDFFDLKGIVENLMRGLQISLDTLRFVPPETPIPIFHSGRQATIVSSGFQVGTIAELHPALLRKLDIHERLFFAECNVQDLMQLPKTALHFEALPAFPSSERDWTVTVDEKITYEEIIAALHRLQSPILKNVYLVSIFRHEKLGANHKNISLRFLYRDELKTVSQSEVDAEHKRLTEAWIKTQVA